ncbi:MerR family transcriptional regulator [Gordonibacter sp. Marseille-P4307]|uniref:MerR family transcriptional regulator n=1 Tax=Gordonibacter sp. Marseille-P4307 TaxID=2161815 RepID=UPI000F5489B7|nr:MerR family transcriptional regulator [Gordonibacter sp. Marseille-P4307]
MSQEENGKLFTTGEIAELCGISVRTVRYYDDRGLVVPYVRSEGGRRLYDEDALGRLRTVCLLKAMGLSLKTIREVLDRSDDAAALACILDEQEKALTADLEERQGMLRSIRDARTDLERSGRIRMGSETGMESIMMKQATEKTRLYRVKRRMVVEGIVLDAVLITAVVLGATRGEWLFLVLVAPLAALVATELARAYRRDARYVCPHCRETLRPSLREFMFSSHNPVARKLLCPRCGKRDWCAETSADSIDPTGNAS